MDRQEYLQAHVQRREEETRLDRLPRKKIDRTPPGEEKAEEGRRTIPRTSLARMTGPTAGRATTTSTAVGEIFLTLLTAG